MKYLIYTIIIAVMFLCIAKTKITFQPFEITFAAWRIAVGWLLIIIGVLLMQYDSERKGLKKGVDLAIEAIQEINLEKHNKDE